MSNTSQRRAIDRYRERLAERGMARFEVLGRKTDRELIRSVAKCLAVAPVPWLAGSASWAVGQ